MSNSKPGTESKLKILLACGAIACPLFVISFVIQGAIRNGYDPFRHPISSLSIGERGWIQVAGFIITGLLIIAFAAGLARTSFFTYASKRVPWLTGLVGLGLTGAGIFSTDPVYGYPADAPLIFSQQSMHGYLHEIFSIPVFIGLPLACFIMRKRFADEKNHRWAGYAVFTGILMLATFILSGLGFKQYAGLENYAGLLQRISIITGWTWMTLLALYILKNASRAKGNS